MRCTHNDAGNIQKQKFQEYQKITAIRVEKKYSLANHQFEILIFGHEF